MHRRYSFMHAVALALTRAYPPEYTFATPSIALGIH